MTERRGVTASSTLLRGFYRGLPAEYDENLLATFIFVVKKINGLMFGTFCTNEFSLSRWGALTNSIVMISRTRCINSSPAAQVLVLIISTFIVEIGKQG